MTAQTRVDNTPESLPLSSVSLDESMFIMVAFSVDTDIEALFTFADVDIDFTIANIHAQLVEGLTPAPAKAPAKLVPI